MVTVEQCATYAELAPDELFLGAPPSAKHRTLLSFYLQDLGTLGPQQVREIIVAEISRRAFLWSRAASGGLADRAAGVVFRISRSRPRRRIRASRTTFAAPAPSRRTSIKAVVAMSPARNGASSASLLLARFRGHG